MALLLLMVQEWPDSNSYFDPCATETSFIIPVGASLSDEFIWGDRIALRRGRAARLLELCLLLGDNLLIHFFIIIIFIMNNIINYYFNIITY